MSHMDSNEHWFKDQYGFRGNHSTSDAVLKLVSNVQESLLKKKYVLCVFLDVAKAFNCLDPEILKSKLAWYGVTGKANEFIGSYLSDRKQISEINGYTSSQQSVPLGVPQGGAFSTTAYIMYNNDLQNATKFNCVLYADDTTLYKEFSTLAELERFGNAELDQAALWFNANRLTLNAKKSHAMILTPKGKPVEPVSLNLSGVELKISTKKNNFPVKFLGVHLDPGLSCKAHINSMVSKVRSGLFALNQVKNFCNKQVRLTIYNALIHSQITYASEVWSFLASQSDMNRISILQKKAIRIVGGVKVNSHSSPLFRKFKVVQVKDLPAQTALKIQARKAHSAWPQGLAGLGIVDRQPEYNLRRVGARRTDLPLDAICNKLLTLWAEMPELTGNSISHAKQLIKNHITNAYSDHCNILNCSVCARASGLL